MIHDIQRLRIRNNNKQHAFKWESLMQITNAYESKKHLDQHCRIRIIAHFHSKIEPEHSHHTKWDQNSSTKKETQEPLPDLINDAQQSERASK